MPSFGILATQETVIQFLEADAFLGQLAFEPFMAVEVELQTPRRVAANIVFVNGVPKLADIGLVAEASEARSFVGTEGFIPPEGPGAPQADLYSLGKVLYEISTGRDRRDFPADLAEVEAMLELNAILLKTCK